MPALALVWLSWTVSGPRCAKTIAALERDSGGPDITTAAGRVTLFTSLFRGSSGCLCYAVGEYAGAEQIWVGPEVLE